MIPLSDPSRYFISNITDLLAVFGDLIRSKQYILGQMVDEFEEHFARYLACDHAVAVGSGTDALLIALLASEVKERQVIIAPNAGGYAANAVVAAGGVPIWADVDSESLLIDIDHVLHQISDSTKAIVVTHLFGQPVDVDRIIDGLRAINRDDIRIIEDCAQSHGAELRGRKLGTIGTLGCFSFYPTKNLGTLGDGGLLSTNDRLLATRARSLRQYGWDIKYRQAIASGRNSRLDELHAAILNRTLSDLDSRNRVRRQILAKYKGVCPFFVGFPDSNQTFGVAHLAVLRLRNREIFMSHLSRLGIATAVHYPYLDVDVPAFKHLSSSASLPIARRAVEEIVSVPCFPEMTPFEIDQVCESLRVYAQ